PHRATEQLVHRRIERLALQVPQGVVDTGDGGAEHRPAAVEAGAGHLLPEVLDPGRVLPEQQVGIAVDHALHGLGVALQACLAPADGAVDGLDPDKQPARDDLEGLDTVDDHDPTVPRTAAASTHWCATCVLQLVHEDHQPTRAPERLWTGDA